MKRAPLPGGARFLLNVGLLLITKEDQPDLYDVENFYQKRIGNFWVALDGDFVIGTVALLDIQNHQVALRKMFVAKKYRGKAFKTTSLLLDNAFEWARQ